MANINATDLNLLRVLDALLRDRATTRAASRLGLSQPAVSAALGRLRATFGDELFFRRGQGLEPTVFALSLEEPLRAVLDAVEALLAGPGTFDPATSQARFRLSGSDFFAEMLMPVLAKRLMVAAPGMRVHLVDLVPDNYLDTLEQYDVDLALVPDAQMPGWMDSRFVIRSSFKVIARKDHPRLARARLQPGDTIPLDLFCDLGHVLFSPEGKPTAMGDAALARLGRQRRVVMTLPAFSGVYRAVAGSDLIALLPTSLARRVAPGAGLELYDPPMPVPPGRIVMVWHRRQSASPAHAWLRDRIADILAPYDEAE